MGGQDDLHIGVQFHAEVYQALLPLDMQRHLRLVHKEHVRLIVLHEHCQQDGQHLLLATRQLIGHQRLTNLGETDLVLRPHDGLTRLRKEIVDDILKAAFLLRQMLGRISMTSLQFRDDTVADIHLIVEILPLQVIELEIEG